MDLLTPDISDILFAATFIIIALLYALTLNRTLLAISRPNRKINANIPFLSFALLAANSILAMMDVRYIPTILSYTSLAIQLFMMHRIQSSLKAEFIKRARVVYMHLLAVTGILFILLYVFSEIASRLLNMPQLLTDLLIYFSYAFWVAYWIGIVVYKNKLKHTPTFAPGSSQIFLADNLKAK